MKILVSAVEIIGRFKRVVGKSLRFCRRVLRITRVYMASRRIYGKPRVALADNEVLAVLLARDVEYFMATYLNYYFSLGVKHVLVIDNGSVDRTAYICRQYDNVTVIRNRLPVSSYEVLLRALLAKRVAVGGWILFADADELIEIPNENGYTLEKALNYCNTFGYTAVLGQMLDHFPVYDSATASDISYPQEVERLILYSLSSVIKTTYGVCQHFDASIFLAGNQCHDNNISFQQGGIRNEVFGENPLLTKHSLIKNASGVIIMTHAHCASGVKVADFELVIRHYKLAGDWVGRDQFSVQQRRWMHGEDAKRLEVVKSGPPFILRPERNHIWAGTRLLREQGFIYASDRFLTFRHAQSHGDRPADNKYCRLPLDGPRDRPSS